MSLSIFLGVQRGEVFTVWGVARYLALMTGVYVMSLGPMRVLENKFTRSTSPEDITVGDVILRFSNEKLYKMYRAACTIQKCGRAILGLAFLCLNGALYTTKDPDQVSLWKIHYALIFGTFITALVFLDNGKGMNFLYKPFLFVFSFFGVMVVMQIYQYYE